MSRCFQFPPPGFELKARPDDVNLIIKEKKEKKKKKHRDKDKKERSKSKENERSRGDNKENKKRKREDNDKKERKKKKKDDQISSEGEKIVGFLENQNGGELVTNIKPTDAIHGQGGALGNQMVQKIATVEKSKVNLDKTERSKMANGQSLIVDARLANGQRFNVDARRLGNGYVGNCNGENRIKIEGGSYQVDKVEKINDGNGRNGYGPPFGKGDGCKNEDTKAKERNGYRNIVGEGNGCKNEYQNKNMRALEKEEKEKMAQDRKEKIKQGSSDFNFLFRANNPSKDGQKYKKLNGFLRGVQPNNTSRPALPCPVEKGAVINNQMGNDKISSPQSVINNPSRPALPCPVEKGAVINNQKGNDKISSPQSVINNHGLSNGHLIHIKRKTEPCPPPANTVAKVNPIVKNHSVVDKVPSALPANTVAKVNLIVKNHSVVDKVPSAPPANTVAKVNLIVKNHSVVDKVPSTPPANTVAKAYPIVKNHSVVDKVPSTPPANTVAKVNPIKNHSVVDKVPSAPPANTVAKANPIVKNHSVVDKVPSTHPLLENGRTIHKTDIKELRTNGSVEGGKHTTSSKPSIKVTKLKLPHPDLKYLSSILCVPREVELPQCDDQDWLFGCKDKRPKLASSPNRCTKQVWAEAIQLESVDITALPYVVRF